MSRTSPEGRITTRPCLPWTMLALCLALSCSKKETKPEPAPSAPGSAAADGAAPLEAAPAPPKKAETPPGMPLGHPVPVGPPLLIAPGQSLGPIRVGTNLETLKRHMDAPCDLLTDDRCVYVKQAVEFQLDEGVVVGIKIHRRDRLVPGAPAKDDGLRYFGTFNGGMRPRIMLGLHRHVVIEEFGEPKKKEPLSGRNGEVERHVYEGVVFEYDELDNGNTVLSAIELVLPASPPTDPAKSEPEVSKTAD